MAPKPTNPFQRTFLVPLVREIQVNSQKANLLIDTGMVTSVAFSAATARKVGLMVAADNGPPHEEKVTLRLDSSEMTDVTAWVYAKGTNGDRSLSKNGAVAGSLFLQQFNTTFDYTKGLVVLERFE